MSNDTKLTLASGGVHADLVHGGVRPGGLAPPARLRSQLDAKAVRALSEQLFRGLDPTDPTAGVNLLFRDLPRIYSESLHGRIHRAFYQAMAGNSFLFLQGAAPGVGAKMMAVDEGRCFNARAKERGLTRRVVHLRITKSTRTERHLLDALGRVANAIPTMSELRLRSTGAIAARIIAGLRQHDVGTIILSDVHNAWELARGVIADLALLADPRYSLDLDVGDAPPLGRISVILVDHHDPRVLFKNYVEVLQLIQGHWMVLPPYQTVEQLAEALVHADVGLHDIDLSALEDRRFVETLLHATNGLAVEIEAVLKRVDVVSAANGGTRPDCAMLEIALNHFHRLTKVTPKADRDGRTHYRVAPASVPNPFAEPREDTATHSQSGDGTGSKKGSSRRAKKEARGDAEAVQKQMSRRSHVNLP